MKFIRKKMERIPASFVCSTWSINSTKVDFRNSNRNRCSSSVARKIPTAISTTLPSWERNHVKDHGLVGTSYESATVESVEDVGQGFLKIAVDMSVTCTSETYLSEGQFLYLKPWGDEDGSIQPCCFTSPPGGQHVMEFYIPETSPVGKAALAGEMLEVSDVMGEGFRNQMGYPSYANCKHVVAVCVEQFTLPTLLALSNETEKPTKLFVLADENGPFANQITQWTQNFGQRDAFFFEEESSLLRALENFLKENTEVALLMSGGTGLCEMTEDLVQSLDNNKVQMLAP